MFERRLRDVLAIKEPDPQWLRRAKLVASIVDDAVAYGYVPSPLERNLRDRLETVIITYSGGQDA